MTQNTPSGNVSTYNRGAPYRTTGQSKKKEKTGKKRAYGALLLSR